MNASILLLLQVAAHEAKLGHTTLANEIRKIIEIGKNKKPILRNLDPQSTITFSRNYSH